MFSVLGHQDQDVDGGGHLEETAGLKELATSTVSPPGSALGSDHLGLLVGQS